MKVNFITCSGEENYEPFRNQPLGTFHLMTLLEDKFKDRIDLSLTDLRGIQLKDAIYHIPESEVYMYSVASREYPETVGIVKKIRETYQNTKHIAGGSHINAFPKESQEIFDTIALGEGEESIKRIVNDLFDSRLKKVYNQQEKININEYPIPLRKYATKSSIVIKGLIGGKYLDLPGTIALFSRGCPYSCHFCANGIMKGRVRFRTSELIKEEINYLKKEYGIKALAIKDDQSIPTNRKISKPILEAIAETDIIWRGQSRANGIDYDIAKLAKESGCHDLGIGIESASQEVLNNINKKIDLDEAQKYLKILKDVGIGRRLHFILGLPGEKEDIADKTIEFIKRAEPSSVLLSLLCPTPGSEIYKNPERFGIELMNNLTFDKLGVAFGRFDENEKAKAIFKYKQKTPFGKSLTMEQIVRNYTKVQTFLRDNNYNF